MSLNEKNPNIRVECYSGYKADEKPVSFTVKGTKHMVDYIIEQWRTPDLNYFKVLADDGKGYILTNDIIRGDWILERVFEL